MKTRKNGLGLAVALAPVIFIGHILEESAGYLAWFNTQVRTGITMPLFWRVNTLSLVIRRRSAHSSRIETLFSNFELRRVCCRSGQCCYPHLQKQALVERCCGRRCHRHCIGTVGLFPGQQNLGGEKVLSRKRQIQIPAKKN